MTGQLLLGAISGVSLATFFLGGLALTLRWLPGSRHPGLLLLSSFALRAVVIVAAFVLLARQGLLAFALAFVIFVLARLATVWLTSGRAAAVARE